ncbi:MAG: transporter [Syntrophotaleaceae bacterium]
MRRFSVGTGMEATLMKRLGAVVMLLLGLSFGGPSWGADPRDYIPLPPKTFLFVTYLQHISGHRFKIDDEVISDDFNLSQNIVIFRPVYYTTLGPFVIDPQCLIIAGEAELDGDLISDTSTQGIADPVVLMTTWFINRPEDKLWLGWTPYVTVPIGEYDKKRALNLGSNRWALKNELGMIKGFGKFYLDLIGNVTIFGDNDDFWTGTDTVTLEQDALFGAEVHLSYDISPRWWIGLSYFYSNGGETEVDGIDQNDDQDNHALMFTSAFGIGDHYQLLLQYRDDFGVKSGVETKAIQVRFAYFF